MCHNVQNKTSEIDTKRIDLFKQFIENNDADAVRKSLTRVFANYSQMLIGNINNTDGAFVSAFNGDELYHLSEMIEILDGGYA